MCPLGQKYFSLKLDSDAGLLGPRQRHVRLLHLYLRRSFSFGDMSWRTLLCPPDFAPA